MMKPSGKKKKNKEMKDESIVDLEQQNKALQKIMRELEKKKKTK